MLASFLVTYIGLDQAVFDRFYEKDFAGGRYHNQEVEVAEKYHRNSGSV